MRTGLAARTSHLCLAIALAIGSPLGESLLAQAPAAAPASTLFKRTLLQQHDLSAPGREFVQVLAEFQPGGATGRHTHPGEEIGYVMAGPVVVEVDGEAPRTYQTGEAFLIPAGKIHNAISRANAARIVVTYVIEKGKPPATPVP